MDGLAYELREVLRTSTARELMELSKAVESESVGRALVRERDDSIHDAVNQTASGAGSAPTGYRTYDAPAKVATTVGSAAIGLHGIGWALKQMHNGARVARRGWNGPGQYLQLQVPDISSRMSLPYVFITTVHGDRVPWLASQTDLLARDWFVR